MSAAFPRGEQQESVTTADGVRLRTIALAPGPDAAPGLVVHGGRDAYLLPANAEALFAAAGEPRELWLWPEYGHAELALTQPQVAAIGSWLVRVAGASMSAS